MKLKCLRYSKLGDAGDVIEISGAHHAKQLIDKGICEAFKAETKPAQVEKKTKSGKKPAEKIEKK